MVEKLSRTLPSRSLEFNLVDPLSVPVESVGALIYCSLTLRFLFLLRNKGKFSDTWGIAGGKLNNDENALAGLLREIKEEIGIKITSEKIIPLETFTADNNYFVYNTYIIIVDREFVPTLNDEHRAYAWTAISDIPRPVHPGLFKTLRLEEINNKIELISKIL